MEQIKVMIVDDEILAIEDIIDLINWEEIDFRIVATAKNGKQAVDKFETYLPDVIISDILMPVMDGLEMSKAVLSMNKDVKLLLLTGYEEFEYAKKAVKIGVYDYVLKNEINKDVLLTKMQELKRVIEKEKYESCLILRNLLADLISGQFSRMDQLSDKSIVRQHEKLFFMLFELDLPFLSVISNFSESKSESLIDANQFRLNIDKLPEDFLFYELVPVERSRIVLLLKQNKNLSEYETRKRLFGLARSIQEKFRTNCGKTLSSYLCLRKVNIDKYSGIYNRLKEISKYKVFYGRGQIFDVNTANIEACNIDMEIDEKKLIESVTDNNSEKVRLYVEQLFNETIFPKHNLEGFISVVKELLHILQNRKRVLYRSSVEFNRPKALIDEEIWYKAEDIKQWFIKQFINIAMELERVNKLKLSCDVQRAVEYIHKFYYKEDLTIGEVSEQIGLSITHLSVKLKKETGMTFLEYLTNYRIEKAKKLLASENYKIYEISNRIGYKTSQYFSQVFYKATGKTPVDYRKEIT